MPNSVDSVLFHTLPVAQVFRQLSSTSRGLSTSQVLERRLEAKAEARFDDKWRVLRQVLIFQANNPHTWLQLLLLMVAWSTGNWIVWWLGLGLVWMYFLAQLWVVHSWTQFTLLRRQLLTPLIRVRRAGRVEQLTDSELVVGDIVLLEPGERVPAAGRIIVSHQLVVRKAGLVNQAEVIKLTTNKLPISVINNEISNMVVAHSEVLAGSGEMIVTKTPEQPAPDLERQRFASSIFGGQLERYLNRMITLYIWLGAIVASLVFLGGWLSGYPAGELLLVLLALAVVTTPEMVKSIVSLVRLRTAKGLIENNCLIKGSVTLDDISQVDTVVIDADSFVHSGVKDHQRALPLEKLQAAGLRVVYLSADQVSKKQTSLRYQPFFSAVDWDNSGQVITGTKLANLERVELEQVIPHLSVGSELTWEQKRLCLQTLITQGSQVLVVSNHRELMGLSTLDVVTKSSQSVLQPAADIVLLDNQFQSLLVLVRSVAQHGATLKNLILYAVIASVSKLVVVASAVLFGLELPITPSQLLWMTVTVDLWPLLALALEPVAVGLAAPGLSSITSPEFRQKVLGFGLVAGSLAVVSVGVVFLSEYLTRPHFLTVAHTAAGWCLIFFQLGLGLHISRIDQRLSSIWSKQFYWQAGLLVTSWVFFATYFPWTHGLFNTSALPWRLWPKIVAFSSLGWIVLELNEWRKIQQRKTKIL